MLQVPEDVIIPPPAIKAMVLKTAQYVARNGSEFEEKIKQQPQASKFTFLDPKDVYHGYYRFLMERPDELLKEEEKDTVKTVQLEPLPALDFTLSLPVISSKDLDTLKLVAQFVAVNGEDYKQAIKNKYHNQLLQFGFMDPGHSLNPLFERCVDQYKLVLSNQYQVVPTEKLLERAYKRAEYEVTQKESTEKQERDVEEKKQRFARVDWIDFVIVETIEFTEVDSVTELEQPVTIEQLQLKSLDEKSKQVTAISLPPPTITASTTTPTTTPTSPPGIKIREFGATRIKSIQNKEKLIQCPITGKMIPEQNFQRHMDILLRDPKYKEEKAKYEAKINKTNLNHEEATDNLKSLVRPKEDNKRQKVVWDGYQSSVDFVKQKNHATEQEIEEYKRKQKEPLIGPTKPS